MDATTYAALANQTLSSALTAGLNASTKPLIVVQVALPDTSSATSTAKGLKGYEAVTVSFTRPTGFTGQIWLDPLSTRSTYKQFWLYSSGAWAYLPPSNTVLNPELTTAPTLLSQSFLPVMTNDRRTLAIIPISTQTFAGTETTITVSGVAYNLALETIQQSLGETWNKNKTLYFMAAYMTPTQERQWYQNNLRTLNYIGIDQRWSNPQNFAQNVRYSGQLTAFYLQAAPVAVTSQTLTTPTGNAYSRNWTANSPFTNVGAGHFMDINWQQQMQVDTIPFVPVSASLGAPSADPGAGLTLRAFLVQSPQVINNVITNSTVRIVKVTQGPVTSGTYTWPIAATDSQGNSASFNLSIVVP